MNKSIVFFIINCTTILLNAEITPHIITFFMRPLPKFYQVTDKNKLKKSLEAPGGALKKIIKKELNINHLYTGIYATYAGFVTTSDLHGQITFPRKTASNKFDLIITNSIIPVSLNPLQKNILTGFVVDKDSQSQAFEYQKIQDPETELYSWMIKEKKLDLNKKLPYDAIVIFANPADIIIPNGAIETNPSENLVLPDLYVSNGLESAYNALKFFEVRQYFAPVKTKYNYKADRYQTAIE